MKNLYIIIIICLISNFQKIKNLDPLPSIYDKILDNISYKIVQILENIPKNDTKQTTLDCLDIIKTSYDGNYNISYLVKLFFDSSPNYEDIKKYYNCYYNIYQNVEQEILDHLTYIIIKYTDKQENSNTEFENCFNSFSKIFGACVPNNCKNEAYLEIINYIKDQYSLIEGNITGVINLKPSEELNISRIIVLSIIPFLLLIFICMIVGIKYISRPFWSLFGFFYYLCNKRKYSKENIQKILKRNKLNQIDTLNAFVQLSLNVEEVMPGSKESQITNENGLHIVVGLRGIFIIGLFLGLTLQNIFTTPTRIFNDKQYVQYMNTKLYCILFFFARISQKMLYALSGFELTFKLLFYFDNKLYKQYISNAHINELSNMNLNQVVDNKKDNNKLNLSEINTKKNSKSQDSDKVIQNKLNNSYNKKPISLNNSHSINKNKNKNKTFSISKEKENVYSINEDEEDNEDNEEEESDECEEDEKSSLFSKKNINNANLIEKKEDKKKGESFNKSNSLIEKKLINSIERGKAYINYKYKLNHKNLITFHLKQFYLYLIFVVSIIFFAFCRMELYANLFERGSLWIMITSEFKEYFTPRIILGTMFLFAGTCSKLKNYYNFFIPAMNEIFFYLFGTTIIYIFYKNNARLDIFLIVLIVIMIIVKIIIFLVFETIYNKRNNYFFPSLEFMQKDHYYLIQMHVLNLSYYCIGMLVGLANFSLQNDAKKKNIVKKFVKLPRKLYYVIKRKYNFIFGLTIFVIFLVCDIFLYKIYLLLNFKENHTNKSDPITLEKNFFKNIFINIFYLFDCEIVIICTFILTIIVFYSSLSFLRDFFKAYPWKILSRIYFPLLITAQMQSNWFLFQFAERIDLTIAWVLYVLTLTFIICIVSSIIIYIFFQVPLKKLTKIIYVEKTKITDELKAMKFSHERTPSFSSQNSMDLSGNHSGVFINGRKMDHHSDENGEDPDGDLELVNEQ